MATSTARAKTTRKPIPDITLVAAPNISWDQSRTPNFQKIEVLEKFLNDSLGHYDGYYACFMFCGDKRHEPSIMARGCHGYMHSTSITAGWVSALRYKNQTELNPEAVDEASRWYVEKFLLGKYSPWAVLLPYLTIVYNQNKIPVAYIVDGEENRNAIDKQLLQNFNIASRWPREFPNAVQAMFDLWLSGHFKKAEALILQNLIRYNPATGVFITLPSGRVGGGHHYYQNTDVYRLLERKPNTGMIFEGGRFVKLSQAMSSNNDKFVWGSDNRNHKALSDLYAELSAGKLGKKTITRFGGVLTSIPEQAVVDFMKKFRDLYESEIKRVPGGVFIEKNNEPDTPVDQDRIGRYIGAYTQTRDVASKF